MASFNSSSSIAVSWSAPVGGVDGYVIIYPDEGGSNMTQLVEGGGQTSSVLTGVNKGQLYTIRVFAYKDLPSLFSDPVYVLCDGEMIIVLFPSTSSPHPLLSSLSSWSSFWCQCCSSLPQCLFFMDSTYCFGNEHLSVHHQLLQYHMFTSCVFSHLESDCQSTINLHTTDTTVWTSVQYLSKNQ